MGVKHPITAVTRQQKTRDTTTARINRAVIYLWNQDAWRVDIITSLSALLPADHSDL